MNIGSTFFYYILLPILFQLEKNPDWDYMNIVYSLIATFLAFLAGKWLGFFKRASNYFKNKKAILNFKKQTINECNSLIIIGKRKGFTLKDVYVKLDIVETDLVINNEKSNIDRSNSFVLLGGPGAGKSTTAKNFVLEHIESKRKTTPFFVRLKDYNGNVSLFDYLKIKLEKQGLNNPEEFLKKNLINHSSLCVLDGLDEVRPNQRKSICEQINLFYSSHFTDGIGKLIVTCRKEAYRDLPLDIKRINEVKPLSDEQIKRFAKKWPIEYPKNKSDITFFDDLSLVLRVKELARSPLLLVGGLMHYTEVNLGIPEQRFEYLDTMAKWLIVDWATAQGHLPDQYRTVYERLLTSLSYYMHKKKLSEINFDEAKRFIETILPNFGYQKEESVPILNSILVRTGILSKEGSSIFFSQFGLQEYFTSKELTNSIDQKEIFAIDDLKWWRESILLYVAQLKDPSIILDFYFSNNPIFGVAAVAECPTPSLDTQKKAVKICIENIDKQNDEIKSSLVPFLRKVKDNVELSFYSELKIRLTKNDEIAKLVGTSLASAGTIGANSILANHPEVWSYCLNDNKGHLSQSFENLLVEWIKDSDNHKSFQAAELLSSRLTNDRFEQLLKILPLINNKKKEHLSRLLIKHDLKFDNNRYHHKEINKNIKDLCYLIPNITKPNNFMNELVQLSNSIGKDFRHRSNLHLICMIFFLKEITFKNTPKELMILSSKGFFSHNYLRIYSSFIIAALLFLVINIESSLVRFLFVFGAFIIFYAIVTVQHLEFGPRYRSDNFSKLHIIHVISGGFLFLSLWDLMGFLNDDIIFEYYISCISILFVIYGFLIMGSFSSHINLYLTKSENLFFKIISKPIFNLLYSILLLAYILIDYFFEIKYDLVSIVSILSIVYLFWLILFCIVLYKSQSIMGKARRKAYAITDKK